MLFELYAEDSFGMMIGLGLSHTKASRWVVSFVRQEDLPQFHKVMATMEQPKPEGFIRPFVQHQQSDSAKAIVDLLQNNTFTQPQLSRLLNTQYQHGVSSKHSGIIYYLDSEELRRDEMMVSVAGNRFLPKGEYAVLIGFLSGELPKDFLYRLSRGIVIGDETIAYDSLTLSCNLHNLYDIDFFNTFEKADVELINPDYSDTISGLTLFKEIPELSGWVDEKRVTPDQLEEMSYAIHKSLMGLMGELSLEPEVYAEAAGRLTYPQVTQDLLIQLYAQFDAIQKNPKLDTKVYQGVFILLGEVLLSVHGIQRPLLAAAILGRFQDQVGGAIESLQKEFYAKLEKKKAQREKIREQQISKIKNQLRAEQAAHYQQHLDKCLGNPVEALKDMLRESEEAALQEAAEALFDQNEWDRIRTLIRRESMSEKEIRAEEVDEIYNNLVKKHNGDESKAAQEFVETVSEEDRAILAERDLSETPWKTSKDQPAEKGKEITATTTVSHDDQEVVNRG